MSSLLLNASKELMIAYRDGGRKIRALLSAALIFGVAFMLSAVAGQD